MPYSLNPHLPKVRMQAVLMVRRGDGIRTTARHFGVEPSTVSRWVARAPSDGRLVVPTKSSRPKSHPHALSEVVVSRIVRLRKETGRCAEVIQEMMRKEGVDVSLSSVKRVMTRHLLINKRSPWKRYHPPMERPKVAEPGALVEIDTIHIMESKVTRIYVYTLIDVFSRFAYARAVQRINAKGSVRFVNTAREYIPFSFQCIQSDHGSEFGTHFTERVATTHRHSRVRTPNDNAHLERFNRTIQEELLNEIEPNPIIINKHLPEYLDFYNFERPHLGLNLKTPSDMLG